VKKISVVYTGQGFEQDAGQAMAGDVVRGLIELITNADDAYGAKSSEIFVEVHRPRRPEDATLLSVRDSATGLTPEAMEKNFTTLGADLSGFSQGSDKRGLFGRGSKDTAWFGRTVFESIRDETYSILQLTRDGTGSIDSRSATKSDYDRLRLGHKGNGLTATIHVLPGVASVPRTVSLVQRLSSHVQLRELSRRQRVVVTEYSSKKKVVYPVKWDPPTSKMVLDETVVLSGYNISFHLTLRQLSQRVEGPVNEYSPHGIEIRGRRSAYMNTMFGLNDFGAGFLSGEVVCEGIDELIREYDKTSGKHVNDLNPRRLVRRDRDGLDTGHPFTQALARAVTEKLKPFIDALEPDRKEGGGKQLRRDLSQIASLLGGLIREDLGEDEDDSGGIGKPTFDQPLLVIPPVLRARLGDVRTLTVLVLEESAASQGLLAASSSEVCDIRSQPSKLIAHKTMPGVLVGQVRIEMARLGSATIAVWSKKDEAIRATSSVLVHDEPTKEEIPPVGLQWKNSQMSITIGRERSLTLQAPVDIAPEGSLVATIAVESGDSCELLETTCTLALTNKGWLVGKVGAKGLKLGSTCSITATSGGNLARGALRATLPSPFSGFNFEIQIVDRSEGSTRGEVKTEPTGRVLMIFARHPALSTHLGQLRADGTYTREREPEARAALGDAIAAVLADYVLRLDTEREPMLYSDVDMILQRRNSLFLRYVTILVKVLRVEASN
jgi:hypothetical protein